MKPWQRYAAGLTGFMILSSLTAVPASAQPNWNRDRDRDSGWNQGRNTQTETIVTPARGSRFVNFNNNQRSMLVDLVRNNRRNDLIPVSTRRLIVNQNRRLSPSIERQLLRGRPLPPGLANRVLLSKQVNSYLNVPTNYDIYVVGSNAVVYDPVQSLVVDLIQNLF